MLLRDFSDADQDHWIGIEGTSGQLVKSKLKREKNGRRFLKQICKSATYVPIVLFSPAILSSGIIIICD